MTLSVYQANVLDVPPYLRFQADIAGFDQNTRTAMGRFATDLKAAFADRVLSAGEAVTLVADGLSAVYPTIGERIRSLGPVLDASLADKKFDYKDGMTLAFAAIMAFGM